MKSPHAQPDGTNDLRVVLVFRDFDGEPDDITAALGITPTFSGKKGDPRVTVTGRVTSALHDHSHWALASGMPRSASLEDHVRALLDSVSDVASRIKAVVAPVKQVYCSIIPNGPVPLLALECHTLARMVELGCDFMIDVLYIDVDEP